MPEPVSFPKSETGSQSRFTGLKRQASEREMTMDEAHLEK